MPELFIAAWIIAGFINYGLMVGHFQGKYPTIAYSHRISDRVFAIILSLFGPIALLTTLFTLDHREWRL